MGNVRQELDEKDISTYSRNGKTVLWYASLKDSYTENDCGGLVEINDNIKGDVARIYLYVYVTYGTASGDNRATDAASEAISSRLLEGTIDGATRVLLSIAGNKDLGIQEINDAADLVAQNVDPDATIIFGTVVDESLGDQVRVTVIATGFNDANVQQPLPTMTMPSSRPAASRPAARAAAPAPAPAPVAAPAPAPSMPINVSRPQASSSNEFDIPDFLKRSRI